MRLTVARAIAKTLEEAGTEYCFGYNGHGNWALLDAFEHETSVQTVAARAEDHAVHMADCYWRVRRQLPLAVVTTSVGPGNANITPAIATAFFDSSALIVLAGSGATHWFDRGGMEEFYRYGPEQWADSQRLITKRSLLVSRPDTALDMLLRAYKTAVTGRPGPVILQIPFDIQHTEIDIESLPRLADWVTMGAPAPDPAAVATAAEMIRSADRPLIWAGGGVHNARAWDALTRLAETASAPVVSTSAGKGVIPETHPLSLGCVGRAGTGHANAAARECDVVVAIGSRFTDIDTGGWELLDIPGKTRLVHVDIDPDEIARVYPPAVGIIADANLAATALTDELSRSAPADRGAWLQRLGEHRQAWERQHESSRDNSAVPMSYRRVFSDVSSAVASTNPDATVLFDTGHALSFGPPYLTAHSRYYIHSGAFHRMGWTLPGAVGASLARGGAPSVVLVGDGSFIMTGSALLTAVELDLTLVVVVLNNRSLQIERELMLKLYGRHSLTDYVKASTGEPFGPDFVKWAQAMGAHAVEVKEAAAVLPTVAAALTATGPTVIDVPIDVEQPGYRAVNYAYPANWSESWAPRRIGAE